MKGLGLLLAGGGTELVRGAATDAEAADRATVEIVPDGDANVQFTPAIQDSDHVQYDDSATDGISIGLRHINLGAITRFEDLLTITNRGANTITEVSVTTVDRDGGGNAAEILEATADISTAIPPGSSAETLGLAIDTTGFEGTAALSQISATITISFDTDT